MHRICALLLLHVISFLLIAPAICVDAASQLPACCRAKGRHHCAMDHPSTGQRLVTEAPAYAVSAHCPMFPKTAIAVTSSLVLLTRTSQQFYCCVLSDPAIHAQTEARFRISFRRTCQKRGRPP